MKVEFADNAANNDVLMSSTVSVSFSISISFSFCFCSTLVSPTRSNVPGCKDILLRFPVDLTFCIVFLASSNDPRCPLDRRMRFGFV